jgi:hypothetical protein
MFASKFLSKTTKKAATLPKATEINHINELLDVINNTDKRHIKALQFTGLCGADLGEYSDIGAEVEGGILMIYDKAKPHETSLLLRINAIRAYHENDLSISIYAQPKKQLGAAIHSDMIVLRSV